MMYDVDILPGHDNDNDNAMKRRTLASLQQEQESEHTLHYMSEFVGLGIGGYKALYIQNWGDYRGKSDQSYNVSIDALGNTTPEVKSPLIMSGQKPQSSTLFPSPHYLYWRVFPSKSKACNSSLLPHGREYYTEKEKE